MKLYLAVATLMLVLIAHSEAQEESTIEQQFANFQARFKEFGDDVTEKTKNALKQIENSEIISKTKDWVTEQLEKVRQKFDEVINKPE
uniref:Apolipoprotein C-I-like protein n=1 Tax=Ictalurus punctatus TaxID=7998 RepID=A0A1C9ULN1_ICTPU|nr:apolipoprotein C-I-like protein [Ictalurus punctatus]